MAIKNVYVDPGDLVVVHVMHNPDLPKNKKEWLYTSRPSKFSFIAEKWRVTFHDPGLDVGFQQSDKSPRYTLRGTE